MNITNTGMGRRTGRPARKTGAVAGDVAAYALAGLVALGAGAPQKVPTAPSEPRPTTGVTVSGEEPVVAGET